MSKYILSLDQGTTSSRSILIDHKGHIVKTAQQEFKQIFPKPGWVEHDAEEIWESQLATAKNVIADAGISVEDISAIGITNQRETTVVWNRNTGKPIHNAIVWQDRRTSVICDKIKADGHAATIQDKTGLVVDAYFSGTKVQWILDNVEGARAAADKGELAFGTIDTWLLYKLTEGRAHKTDVSNASRTMLCNIQTGNWDGALQDILKVPGNMLPQICSSSEVYGNTSLLGAGKEIPIAGIAGDQQAALFGQLCTKPGMVKNTYGTGCFMLMNTGDRFFKSKNNLLTTIAWKLDGKITYALEGSVFIGGAVVQWLRDGLGIIKTAPEVEALAKSVKDNDGVYVVPAFSGLGAPHWNPHARGTISGISRGTTTGHIARAALESICYQTTDVLKAMEADAEIAIEELRVDGGAANNDLMMQFQSDVLGTEVIRPTITETTALGAAYLAGLAVGFWESVDALQEQWQIERKFSPDMKEELKQNLLQGWKNAVDATITLAETVQKS